MKTPSAAPAQGGIVPGIDSSRNRSGGAKTDLGALANELVALLADAVKKQLAAGRLHKSAHARLIARYFGIEHTKIFVEAASVDLLPLLTRQYDQPVINSSTVSTFLVSQQISRRCTLALGGDVGNELFAGYSHYDGLLRMHRCARLLPLRRGVRAAATRALPPGEKGLNWLQALGADFAREVPLVASYFDTRQQHRLLDSQVVARATPAAGDLLPRATRLDFATYLPEDVLVKVDRASMLQSLEVCTLMLDRRVLEFAFGRVPSALKTVPDGRKLLLKELARHLLPPEFGRQRNQGFRFSSHAGLTAVLGATPSAPRCRTRRIPSSTVARSRPCLPARRSGATTANACSGW